MPFDFHPFKGRTLNDTPIVPYGTNVPTSYSGNFNPNDVRSLGLRCPTVLVGWGYDKQGRPAPSNKSSLQKLNNESLDYQQIKFLGGNASGATTPPSGYIAAPLDLRFDYRSGSWDTDHSFLAKVGAASPMSLPGGANASLYPLNKYPWTEVSVFDSNAKYVQPTYPASGNLTQSYAINLAEYGVTSGYVPSGTIVEMKALKVQTASPNDSTLIYYFNRAFTTSFSRIPAILTASQANMLGGTNNNRWLYSWVEAIYHVGQLKWLPNPSGISSNSQYTAFNRFENHNNGLVEEGMGVVVGSNSGVSVTMKAIPSGVVVMLDVLINDSGSTNYTFDAVNAYDVVCDIA
jgi:hypothetical protein